MHHPPDILSLASRQPLMHHELDLLQEKDQQIPGSVQYVIKRYRKHSQWSIDDTGMMVYHYSKNEPGENYFELRFCMAGNGYHAQRSIGEHQFRPAFQKNHDSSTETIDLVTFRFLTLHLLQFVKPSRPGSAVINRILQFKHPSSFTKILPLCGRIRMVLESLLNHTYKDSLENIFINAQTQMLLLYSMECMVGEKEMESFSCKFLANEADREKITRAREILLQHIGEPVTIKELSRKAAINECYLKKGFKEMFGTTIFDFYQSQRMEHARYLLYEKGLSVTDVSLMLGYSSISHFSTAFKKHTGLKPCELLFH